MTTAKDDINWFQVVGGGLEGSGAALASQGVPVNPTSAAIVATTGFTPTQLLLGAGAVIGLALFLRK